MTVAAAWVRTLRDCQELVFVADSRLSGDGRNFDYSPKILTLPRSDCVISFAGYTGDAYPLMLQLSTAIESHIPLRRGSVDITALKTHALKVFGAIAESIEKTTAGESSEPTITADFLFGGYSWVKKRFQIWRISYESKKRQFKADPAPEVMFDLKLKKAVLGFRSHEHRISLGQLAFGGDQARNARDRVLELLTQRLREITSGNIKRVGLDLEPFEVIRDMLRDPTRSHTIGGAPQMMKVYQYMQAGPLAVYSPRRENGRVFLRGRPQLPYERLDNWIFDPDGLTSTHPRYPSRKEPGSPEEETIFPE